jgi:hypothetical protein
MKDSIKLLVTDGICSFGGAVVKYCCLLISWNK